MSHELERLLRDARAALPLPSARATNDAREAVIGSSLRRKRGRLQATAAVVVLLGATAFGIVAGLLVAPSGGASSPATVTGLGFLPAKGWSVVQSGPGVAQHSIAVATNVPVSSLDVPLDGPPYTTIRRLPPDGTVIYAEFTARGNVWTDLGYPADAGVPQLDEAYRETAWNDQIRPEDPLGQYLLQFSNSGYNVEVHAYIGRLRPTDAQLAAAQEQLDRMIVAGDPVTLDATPKVVPWSSQLTLTGAVANGRANEDVAIEERRCGSSGLHRRGLDPHRPRRRLAPAMGRADHRRVPCGLGGEGEPGRDRARAAGRDRPPADAKALRRQHPRARALRGRCRRARALRPRDEPLGHGQALPLLGERREHRHDDRHSGSRERIRAARRARPRRAAEGLGGAVLPRRLQQPAADAMSSAG